MDPAGTTLSDIAGSGERVSCVDDRDAAEIRHGGGEAVEGGDGVRGVVYLISRTLCRKVGA